MTADSNPAESVTESRPSTTAEEPHPVPASEMSEDQALALVQRPEVTAETLVSLARNPSLVSSRKIAMALAVHPRTPRHLSVPMLRRLFTFDLMRVALTPAVATDIKRTAEEQLINRLESLSVGERTSLARRASGRVAAALLRDTDPRILSTALDNARLVEAYIVTTLMKPVASKSLFNAVSGHPKWSLRREVQIALLRSENTPLERAMELAKNFSEEFLREIVPESRRAALIQATKPSNTGASE